jgi:ectoine hydroxylase-related dioxygenase (phytanoyl-CoA dioxygenase family)
MDTAELKERYERDGFVKVARLIGPADLAAIEAELDRYHREVVPTLAPAELVREPGGGGAIRNLWRLERHSAFFHEFAHSRRLLDLAAVLVNGEAEVWGAEIFAKPARVGSAVPYHQDNAYFNFTPSDSFSCWIALDAASEENGCVYYARRTHRQRLPHKASGVAGNSMGLADPPPPGSLDEEAAVLEPGDAMLHHCEVIHRSEPNRSTRPRRGLVIVYRGKHVGFDEAGRAEYLRVLSTPRKE